MMKTLFDSIAYYAKHNPEREAVVTEHQTISYADLQVQVDRLAAELMQIKSQNLAIYGSNSIEWIVVDLAAKKANITVVPIPLFFSEEQIKHLLSDSQADTVFMPIVLSDVNQKPVTLKWLEELKASKVIKHISAATAVRGQFIHLVNTKDQIQHSRVSLASVKPSKITYTSGSTGTPKGVCLGEDTLDSITDSLSSVLTSLQLGRHLCLIPFATLLENIAGIYVALSMGRSLIVGEVSQFGLISNHEFKVQNFVNTVNEYQIESVILLPQMLKAIVEYITAHNPKGLSSLKFIAVGGGKVSPDLLTQCEKLGLPVYEGYGLSECASVVSLNLPNALKIGSVGRLLPHVEVKIDPSGEVLVKGNAMQGYLNELPASQYIHTGDAGFFDAEGYLFITGRIKQIIVSSFGRNISPEWVESNSASEPEIHQIAIFGEAQPYLSAVIYAKDSVSNQMLDQAIQKANSRMPDYARIQHWCRAEEPFSLKNEMLTDNGKLRRNAIQQRFKADLLLD